MKKKESLKGWQLISSNPDIYKFELDENIFYSGRKSGLLYSKKGAGIGEFATIMQKFQASIYIGKQIKMSCYLKTEQLSRCQAWLQINDSYDDVIMFKSIDNSSLQQNTDWNQYSMILDVPKEGASILFGVQLFGIGKGKVWADNFSFEEVNEVISGVHQDTKMAAILRSML